MAGSTLTKAKLVKELEERGFLIRRDEKNAAHSHVPGFGSIQCYKLALSFIGEPESFIGEPENPFLAASR